MNETYTDAKIEQELTRVGLEKQSSSRPYSVKIAEQITEITSPKRDYNKEPMTQEEMDRADMHTANRLY